MGLNIGLLMKMNFILLGFLVLSPWNLVTSSLYYFNKLYPDHNVNFIVSLPMISGVIVSSIIVYWIFEVLNFYQRVMYSMLLSLGVYFMILIDDFSTFCSFIFISNFLSTMIQSSVYGQISKIPFMYIRLFNTGTGINGLYMSIFSIISLAVQQS